MTPDAPKFDQFWAWVARNRWRARVVLVVVSLALLLPMFSAFPVTDRDEALFAQSSRQMAQTGDLIRIRFLDEARHKKPVGIYWFQAAAAALTVGAETPVIWPYRMPSLLAALVAVLLTHAIAGRLARPEAALGAGLLLAASFVVAGEARLAKTDAMLLATTLASMAVLVRVWIGRGLVVPQLALVQFWGCLALAVLVKGPIGPAVVVSTLVALAVMERDFRWSRPLAVWWGPVLFLAIAAPWYLAVTWTEGAAFWQASLGQDLIGKVASAQEGHGAPPGSYLATLPLGFWPGSALLAMVAPMLWRARKSPVVRLTAAWVLPFWILLEATPTKLIHYPLPLYPALALATATLWMDAEAATGRIWRWVGIAVAGLGLAVPAAAIGISVRFGTTGLLWPAFLLLAAAGCLVFLLRMLQRDARLGSIACLVAMAGFAHAATLTALARTPHLWPTASVATRIAELPACPTRSLSVTGFREPSLAFLSPVPLQWGDPETAARHLSADPCAVVVVAQKDLARVQALAGQRTRTLASVEGFAIGSGRSVSLTLLGAMPPAP